MSETQELRTNRPLDDFTKGHVKTGKGPKPKANSKFENYFDYHEPISSLIVPQNSHRYLAIRRGWVEEELALSVGGAPEDTGFEENMIKSFEAAACTVPESPGAAVLQKAARLAFKAHVFTSIESEAHRALKEVADETAIKVFAENVRKLILASPFGPKAVLGIDPGIRTGCKLAVVDDGGKYVGSTVIHMQTDEQKQNAAKLLVELVKTGNMRAVAVGNGTAGRETESFTRAAFKEAGIEVPVVMVSEAGASVYSASEVAREEFPELDVTVRGAISIARAAGSACGAREDRSEKRWSGGTQHDVAPASLKKSLELIVDSCVNSVGVNLNTASYHLLAHVSGIGPALAKAIVGHRSRRDFSESRAALMEVPRSARKRSNNRQGFLAYSRQREPPRQHRGSPRALPDARGSRRAPEQERRDLMGPGVALVRSDKRLPKKWGHSHSTTSYAS